MERNSDTKRLVLADSFPMCLRSEIFQALRESGSWSVPITETERQVEAIAERLENGLFLELWCTANNELQIRLNNETMADHLTSGF